VLILFHIFTGIIIGLALSRTLKVRGIFIFPIIGAILPDLFDKPLGHIFLADSIGHGRIYCHTLCFLMILSLIALGILWRYRSWALPLVCTGIAAHQIADTMWEVPANWLYPFLGPFIRESYSDYWLSSLLAEITSPSEWIFFFYAGAFFILLYQGPLQQIFPTDRRWIICRVMPLFSAVFLILSLFALYSGITAEWNPFTGLISPVDNFIFGLTCLFGFIVTHRRFTSPPNAEPDSLSLYRS
jgi:hypothetical protein